MYIVRKLFQEMSLPAGYHDAIWSEATSRENEQILELFSKSMAQIGHEAAGP